MPKLEGWNAARMRTVSVAGSGDNVYTVGILGTFPKWCTCPNFEHRSGPRGEDCKHMKARRGRQAIGRTVCKTCNSYLSPSDIQHCVDHKIAEPDRVCSECSSVQ